LTVVSLSKGGYWADEIRKLNIEVIELERRSGKELRRLLKLIEIFKDKKPQIVHTSATSANFYGRIAARLTNVPIIISSERNSVEIGAYKTRTQLMIDKSLSFFTDAIICNSHHASDTLIRNHGYKKDKVSKSFNYLRS